MATQAQQLEQALKLAKAKGYQVTPNKPTRQSLVENYRTPRRRNDLAERLERYGDLEQLADPTIAIDEKLIPQMLKDFSLLKLYKDGIFDGIEER